MLNKKLFCVGVIRCPTPYSALELIFPGLIHSKTCISQTHIRGRGWLKARENALPVLLDDHDFKHKLKLSKVKHTSQDLCRDFS